ncbi:MAG: hypothetical protein RQ842_06035 [Vulcanisaeta sp.]|nr:hypothetical protein [Vulcanisaeta sp.]
MLAGRQFRRAVGLLNPGVAGWLFILFFIILFAIIAPIAFRIGKLFVRPIFWLYESSNYSVGLSLTGSVIPAIVTIILAWLLHKRRRRVVPAIMASKWFWFFVIIYVVIITALPMISPTAAAVLLSLNTPMMIAAPLIFITAFGLAHEIRRDDYWIATEAYIALFIPLVLSDSTTALMAGVATETVHLFTKASLVIGGYGAMDGLILIPLEAAITALITVVAVRHLDVLKIVFKNALVDIGLSVLIFTGVLLGLRLIPYNLAGPIFGAAITLFATGLYSATNYLSSTTTLSHELDVECWSYDCRNGRISALIENRGRVVVRDAKGVVTVSAVTPASKTFFLRDFLTDRSFCRHGFMLVNEINPHIIGEPLPWALPEKPVYKLLGRNIGQGTIIRKYLNAMRELISLPFNVNPDQAVNELKGALVPMPTTYEHITSISPGQRNRLLIFNYDILCDGCVVRVVSEYGDPGPNDLALRPERVCLWLEPGIKYELGVVVHGEGLRDTLGFTLHVTCDWLYAVSNAVHAGGFISESAFKGVLRESLTKDEESIVEKAGKVRARVFELDPSSTKDLGEYLGIAREFGHLWGSLLRQYKTPDREVDAYRLGEVFGVLYEYLVYLVLSGRWGEFFELWERLNNYGCVVDDDCIMTRLLLNLITDEKFKVEYGNRFRSKASLDINVEDLYKALERSIPREYRPALRIALEQPYLTEPHPMCRRIEQDCNEVCSGNKECECIKASLIACNDQSTINKVKSIFRENFKKYCEQIHGGECLGESKLLEFIESLNGPAIAQLYVKVPSRVRFTLMLYALARGVQAKESGDAAKAEFYVNLAAAHALIGSMEFGSARRPRLSLVPGLSTLFYHARQMINPDKVGTPGYKLALLRLYHYNVQASVMGCTDPWHEETTRGFIY